MRRKALFPLLLLLLLPACASSLLLGASGLSARELAGALLARDTASRAYLILVHIRLPRLLGALVSGGCLAASGCILQSVLSNPLASPSVIGVNSGAGLAALLAMLLAPRSFAAVPPAAFAGALGAALLVFAISTLAGASRGTLILSGVAVSTLLSALMDALVVFFPDAAVNRSSFAIGGFEAVTLERLSAVAPMAALGLGLSLLLTPELSILSMGEEPARAVGLRAGLFRLVFLALAALLAACAVSLCGLVSFVGLIAPHTARLLCPRDPRARLPAAALIGALLCTGCDLAARLLFAPYELPVGVLLSLMGVPFFLVLLLSQKRRNRHDLA